MLLSYVVFSRFIIIKLVFIILLQITVLFNYKRIIAVGIHLACPHVVLVLAVYRSSFCTIINFLIIASKN